jgi:hypothetical protein
MKVCGERLWKNWWFGSAPHRKPLLIKEARQVGKTWLMKESGRERPIYISLPN